jgi:hypothetical protein
VQPGAHALDKSRLNLACEVELPVERGQQLDRFDPAVVPNDLAATADKFIGKVFEGMGELFQGATSLRSDSSTDVCPSASCTSPLERFHQKEGEIVLTGRPRGCHVKDIDLFSDKIIDVAQLKPPGIDGEETLSATPSIAYVTRLTNI